jgi:Flp pilus assembly protein TadG
VKKSRKRGSTAVHLLVLFVPVFFGFMGFAIDLGRMYLIRGELKTAANAMALAAAQRLTGTEASLETAGSAARLVIANSDGFGNKYNFGGIVIGEGTGTLTSVVNEPAYFETRAAAVVGEGPGGDAAGVTARHVRVNLVADAPLVFWSFLSLGQSRKTPIAAQAVAGMSAPMCTACGIEPIGVAPLDPEDTTHFGFVPDQQYTLGYQCNGNPTPAGLAGTRRIPYILLNRLNDEATLFPDEAAQAYRMGASGLPPNTNQARACFTVNASETVWVNGLPAPCGQNRLPAAASYFTCGLANRFDLVPGAACEGIPEVQTIASAYLPDTDLNVLDSYTAYTGTGRRVITIPIVDVIAQGGGTMQVLGFRQFLLQPNVSPQDTNGRFLVTYIGSVVPVKQGSFQGCSLAAGPGKVVLHQ